MRVPVSSSPQTNNNHSPNSKLTPNIALRTPSTSNNIIINNDNSNSTPTLSYEPTSVLDLCRSPSPEKKPTIPKPEPEDRVEQDEHVLHNSDWWDSVMKDLGLHDESGTPLLKTDTNPNHLSSNPCIPDFPPSLDPTFDQPSEFPSPLSDIYTNQNLAYSYSTNNTTNLDHLVPDFNPHNSNIGFDFIEELIRAADCFDSNQLQLAQVILERLNQRLRSPVGKPLHRAAFHFKDALLSLLSGSNRTGPPRLSSMPEIVQTIRTFKAFSGISPIPMFSIFTTNQVLLEALYDSSLMHVVDFDIGLGIQYASLMKEIAESPKINKFPILRITAVVPEDYYALEGRLVRENLSLFASELGIRLQIEFLQHRTFETSSFKAVKFVDGERTAVLLSPAIFRRLGSAALLRDVRRISPAVVVFVDGEGWAEAAAAASFRRGVVSSLEYYSMMLESLDATVAGGGGGGDWVRGVEMTLLRPKIFAAVEGVGRRAPPWREAFYGSAMRPVQLSQFADFQAECLLGKVQIRGFHVAKRQAELVLFWQERAMVVTSAWRC